MHSVRCWGCVLVLNDGAGQLKKIQSIPVPRAVRFNFLDPAFVPILLNIAVIVFVAIFSFGRLVDYSASLFGESAQATVNSFPTWKTRSGIAEEVHYGVNISFPSPENNLNAMVEIKEELYHNIVKGDKVAIRYLKDMPNHPYIGQADSFVISLWAILFLTMVSAMAGIVLAVKGSREMLSRGIPVIAEIKEETRGYRDTVFWTAAYKHAGMEYSKILTGSGENPGRILLLVNPLKPKKVVIFGKHFMWKLK